MLIRAHGQKLAVLNSVHSAVRVFGSCYFLASLLPVRVSGFESGVANATLRPCRLFEFGCAILAPAIGNGIPCCNFVKTRPCRCDVDKTLCKQFIYGSPKA